MTDGSTLYFGGYRDHEPGDFIPVYRNDQCLGWICWTLQTEHGSKEFTHFVWCYTMGAHGKATDAYSLDEAKEAITQAFVLHMRSMGCEVHGFSKKPQAEDVDHVALLLTDLKSAKTSKEVDSFMGSRHVKRRLKEMPKLFRTQVTGEAEKLFQAYWAAENPEPEVPRD